jgi:hypothetical protein
LHNIVRKTKTSRQWNTEKSKKADQSGSKNSKVVKGYDPPLSFFFAFPRSIKVFVLFGSGFAGLGVINSNGGCANGAASLFMQGGLELGGQGECLEIHEG